MRTRETTEGTDLPVVPRGRQGKFLAAVSGFPVTNPIMPYTPLNGSDDAPNDVREKIREHRDDLEDLTETDLPAARWAARLLDIADGGDAG